MEHKQQGDACGYLVIPQFIVVAQVESQLLLGGQRQDGLLQFHCFQIAVIHIFVSHQSVCSCLRVIQGKPLVLPAFPYA